MLGQVKEVLGAVKVKQSYAGLGIQLELNKPIRTHNKHKEVKGVLRGSS